MAQEKRFQTPRGRLSWPFLFKPRTAEKAGDKEKYSCSLIFDAEAQKTEEYKAIVGEVRRMALEKFGVDQPQPDGTKKRIVPKGVRNPIRDGADKIKDDGTPMDGYGPGTIFISATSERPPGVIGGDMKPVGEADAYPGVYARASLTVYFYERKDGKGVTFGLRNVQIMGGGEPFMGGGDPTKDFAPVADFKRTGPAQDFGSTPTGSSGDTDDGSVPF